MAIAERLMEAGRYEEAMELLSEALRLLPDDAGILNDLGVACMAARRFGEAVASLRRSIDRAAECWQ